MTTPRVSTSTDPSATHRLPYTVEPRRYQLRLAPDLDAATFSGDVRIDATAHDQVTTIALHGAELTVTSAEVVVDGRPLPATATVDEVTERIVLSPAQPVGPGPIVIVIGFTGVLNDKLHGFYRSTYTDAEGGHHTLATTQFEATDARRAFPCFDEPDRKAIFSVTLDVPSGLEAFSNAPVLSQSPLPDGARRVHFADTMVMSTYLVAFVVGDLVATEPLDVDGTPVRVIHVPGKEGLTTFALEAAAHALRFFTRWFGIDYPAEKLDLLAIPDFAFGAMENLGCVTFREALLLVDPERASRLDLERIADVVSHEIAHMWFGDLVTMKWWNGIWLNEAFATLMELLCVDSFRPEWRRWVSFGIERDLAMATDSLHATRPVEYPVGSPDEAQGMFDVLTYQKGASVLRMLERYLGEDAFRAGIRRYLESHRFANTETADLWDAIEAASGEPVRDIMDSWILQGGFPLVTVGHAGDDAPGTAGAALTLTQEAFSFAPPTGASSIGSDWRIPVLVRSTGGSETRVLLGSDPAVIALDRKGDDDDAAVVNAGASGFYRVRYPADHLRRLAARIGALDALERFTLLGDTWASVVAGRAGLEDFLLLADAIGNEEDPDVWGQVSGALRFLDHTVDDPTRPVVAAYTRSLMTEAFARLGWQPLPGEGERTATLRAQLLGMLGTVGQDEGIRAECAARHAAAVAGGPELDPNLATTIVNVAATVGGAAEFDTFLELYRHPTTPQSETRYLYSLTAFRDPDLAARVFELARTEVRTQNAPFVVQQLLAHRDHGPATWARVRQAWDELMERFPAHTVPRMLDGVRLLCRDRTLADEVRGFIGAHPVPSGQRTVDQIVERLGVNEAFVARIGGAAALLTAATDPRRPS
ncbi:MAG TPA: M1 family metallopeptidase [Acidimicrobiales bacterium]|nr:M1 family metallopeptidase [Acidimicrobiales bacterium]